MSPAVLDASALVPALIDEARTGSAATAAIRDHDLHAPHLLQTETLQVLRRLHTGSSAPRPALHPVQMVLDFPLTLWPFEYFARRAWELRANLTVYDASYVALAEQLDASLITLDRRLSRAPGIRCRVIVPT